MSRRDAGGPEDDGTFAGVVRYARMSEPQPRLEPTKELTLLRQFSGLRRADSLRRFVSRLKAAAANDQ